MPNNYDEIKEIPGYPKIPLGRAEDLRNKKFNYLTPLYRTENKGRIPVWCCKCDCGNITAVMVNNLRTEHTKSCGCKTKELYSQSRKENLIGQKFGSLTVIEEDFSKNRTAWKCRCDCGNIVTVTSCDLKSNHIKSCGCQKKRLISEAKKENLIGQKFGRLTVIEEYPFKERTAWKCLCDCGNTTIATSTSLKSGHVTSCGCYKAELISQTRSAKLTNQRFGKLLVLKEAYRKDGCVYWECKCDCGNIVYIPSARLLGGQISCGCINSKGEEKINIILSKNNIDYITQKTFNGLVGENNTRLRFDFYINNHYLLEYDGIQHFQPGPGWNTKEKFEKRKQYDEFKNKWCKENNIPLIRIPYTRYDNLCLEDLLLETSQFRYC